MLNSQQQWGTFVKGVIDTLQNSVKPAHQSCPCLHLICVPGRDGYMNMSKLDAEVRVSVLNTFPSGCPLSRPLYLQH